MSEIRTAGMGSTVRTVTGEGVHSEVRETTGPGFIKIREAYEGAKRTIEGLNRQVEELNKENERLKKQLEMVTAPLPKLVEKVESEDNTPPRGTTKKVTTKRRDY